MSTIYLLRHADAVSTSGTDADRPLSPRGRRDARRLGRFLADAGQLPGRFISSTAVRARKTAELLSEGGACENEIPFRSSHALYRAEPADVLDEIQSVDGSVESIMLVGHEPSWSTTVSRLVGSARVSLSPGTCVRIDCDAPWRHVEFRSGVLRWMLPPILIR